MKSERQPDFISKMLGELQYAEEKHNDWPTDMIHASAIITEEVGKLTQACIDHRYGNYPHEAVLKVMEEKVLRVAAMTLRFYSGMPQSGSPE